MSTTLPNIHSRPINTFDRPTSTFGSQPTATPTPRPPPQTNGTAYTNHSSRRPLGTGPKSNFISDEKENENSNRMQPSPPTRMIQGGGGSYTVSRFTLDVAPDPHLFQAVKNYLPFVLYHAHPNARDVEISDAGVAQLFDTVAASQAGSSSGVPSSTAVATSKLTLAKIQELSMTGQHFTTMEALNAGLRAFLQENGHRPTDKLGYMSSKAVPSTTSTTKTGKSAMLILHPSPNATHLGLDESNYRRIKANAASSINEHNTDASHALTLTHYNPYLREGGAGSLVKASSASHDSVDVWTEATIRLESDAQTLYDFLRGPACRLWADPNTTTKSGTSASAANVEFSVIDVIKLLTNTSGTGVDGGGSVLDSSSLIQMIHELNDSHIVPTFTSLLDLQHRLHQTFLDQLLHDVMIYLAYPGECGGLLPIAVSTALTPQDITQLIHHSQAGLWTFTHLWSLSATASHFSSFLDLIRALKQLENERTKKLDELYQFMNDPSVLRELFVTPPRVLKPSEKLALGTNQPLTTEPNLPSITLQQVTSLMFSTRGGNNTLHYVKILVEQFHATSVVLAAGEQPQAGASGDSSATPAAPMKKFESFAIFMNMVREIVMKDVLFQTLTNSQLFASSANSGDSTAAEKTSPSITMDAVNFFYRFLVGSLNNNSSSNNPTTTSNLTFFQPGWNLITYLRGLDRHRQRHSTQKFHDLPELIREIVGEVSLGSMASTGEKNALVLASSNGSSVSPALLTQYTFYQFQERKRLWLSILQDQTNSSSATIYSGPRLSAEAIDELYESTGLGLINNSYCHMNSIYWSSLTFLAPFVQRLNELGHVYHNIATFSHAIKYVMEVELVRTYLHSSECRLINVSKQSLHPQSASSSTASKSLNLSPGDIDLLFQEIKEGPQSIGGQDLHLLLFIMKKLNKTEIESADGHHSTEGQYRYFNLQELLTAIRHEYNALIFERTQVYAYLTQDTYGSRLIQHESSGLPIRITFEEVITLIHESASSPDTLRYLKTLASGTDHTYTSLDSLIAGVKELIEREVQEKWRIFIYLTNGDQPSSPTNANNHPTKPHGLFRQAHVLNMNGSVSPSSASAAGSASFSITSAAIDRLFLLARFQTLKYLKALDLTNASFTNMTSLETTIKHLEMKARVLKYLNSPFCQLFIRPNPPQTDAQAPVDSSNGPTTSIPTQFTGHEIEELWTKCHTGLSTLTYLKQLESRIGANVGHVSPHVLNQNSYRPIKGQYTSWEDLLQDLFQLHQTSLQHRKQILTYLVHGEEEVGSVASESTSAVGGETSSSNSMTNSSHQHGCHHFFRELTYPFCIRPEDIDELFEGDLFQFEEERQQLEAVNAAAADGSNESTTLPSTTSPTNGLLLINSASILPILRSMNDVHHLSFKSWSELKDALRKSIVKLEEEKLNVLIFLTLQSNLIAPPPTATGMKSTRLQLSMNDIDVFYSRFGLIESGLPVLSLLQSLKAEQDDLIEEEKEFKLAISKVTSADSSAASTPDFSYQLSPSSIHTFHSMDELGRVIQGMHRTILFYKQRALMYLKFPKFGHLLCHPKEKAPGHGQNKVILNDTSSTNIISSSSSLRSTMTSTTTTTVATPPTISFSDLDILLQTSGINHPSLLLPFLRTLDANQYHFTDLTQLSQALRKMWQQWIGTGVSSGMSGSPTNAASLQQTNHVTASLRKYKPKLLRFVADFIQESAGLFELTNIPSKHNADSSTVNPLPYSTLPESVVEASLENLDQFLIEIQSLLPMPSNSPNLSSRSSGGAISSPSAFNPYYLLLTHLRTLTNQAPAFNTWLNFTTSIKSWIKSWNKLAHTITKYLNDPQQCSLLPLIRRDTPPTTSGQSYSHDHTTHAPQTRHVSLDQVFQFLLETSSVATNWWIGMSESNEDAEKTDTVLSSLAQKILKPLSQPSPAFGMSTGAHPQHDLIERLLELDASGKTYNSLSDLITGINGLQLRLISQKRETYHYLCKESLHHFWTKEHQLHISTAIIDRLFSETKASFHLLGHLKVLSKRGMTFTSIPALIEAVRNEHDIKLGNQLKILQFLLHPNSRSLFVPASAVSVTSHSPAPPIKLSFQLVSRMYHTIGAGPSTLNYLVALQSNPNSPKFASLAELTTAIQALVNRDRVALFLEHELELGTGGLFRSTGIDLSPALVDEFLHAAGTDLSTMMYLQHLARVSNSSKPGYSSLLELAPILRRMHADSIEERRRAFNFLNDFSVQSLLVAPKSKTNLNLKRGHEVVPDMDETELVGDEDGSPIEETNEDEAPAPPVTEAQQRATAAHHYSITAAQIDTIFEIVGAHSFTLLHLQTLSTRLSQSFHTVSSLIKSLKRLEAESRAQRNEVLIFLNQQLPQFLPPKHRESMTQPDESSSLVTLEEVEELFLLSAAGNDTLDYLKQIASGFTFVSTTPATTTASSSFSLSSPPQFTSFQSIISVVSVLHERNLEQRMRVLQFINNQERCTLLNGMSAGQQTDSSNHNIGGTSAITSPLLPYIPLAAIDSLYHLSNAGLLTLPFLLALQAAGFTFHSLTELEWSVKTAYESWPKDHKRALLWILQQGDNETSTSGSFSGGKRTQKKKLLNFGGQQLDPTTHQTVNVPLDELISISDIDNLFVQSQAGGYILSYLNHSLTSTANGAELSFTNWSAFIEAITREHDLHLQQIYLLLQAKKVWIFTAAACQNLTLSTQDLASQVLFSHELKSGAIGLHITFYLKALVKEQEQTGSFPKVESLSELSSLVSQLYQHDLFSRQEFYSYFSQPAVTKSIMKSVPGGNNTHLRITMDVVNRIFDELAIIGEWNLLHLKRLQSQGKKFGTYHELIESLKRLYEESSKDRKAILTFLNDDSAQSLFSDARVVDSSGQLQPMRFSAYEVLQLYTTAQTYGSTLPLLKLFDSLQLKFLTLVDLSTALHSFIERADTEKAKIWKFLADINYKMLAIPEQVPFRVGGYGNANLNSKAGSNQIVPPSFSSTFELLGISHPATEDATKLPTIATRNSLTENDIDTIYDLCRIGPHILRMLYKLYSDYPDTVFHSLEDLCDEICRLFHEEVELKKAVVHYLKADSCAVWGPNVQNIPDDLEVTVDLYTQDWTLRYLQRVNRQNQALMAQSSISSPFNFPTTKDLFQHLQSCYEADRDAKYHILKWLKDPISNTIFQAHDVQDAFTTKDLDRLFTQVSTHGSTNGICEDYSDLFTALKTLEVNGTQVNTTSELALALIQEFAHQQQQRDAVGGFVTDVHQFQLFGRHALPHDFLPRILSKTETIALDGFTLTYLQLLNHIHSRQGSTPFTSTDQVLTELRHLHTSHANARRSLWLWLNNPAYCSLIQPFQIVTTVEVERIYQKHLIESVANLTNHPTAGSDPTTPFIALQTMLYNMQSAGLSFPNFAGLVHYLTTSSHEAITKYGIKTIDYLHRREEEKRLAKVKQEEASRQREHELTQAWQEEQARVQKLEGELDALRKVYEIEATKLKDLLALRAMESKELRSLKSRASMDQMALAELRTKLQEDENRRGSLPVTSSSTMGQVQLSDLERDELVAYFRSSDLFSETTEEIQISPDTLNDLVQASGAGGTIASTIATLKRMDAAKTKFTSFSALIAAVRGASAIPQPIPLSEADQLIFVEYLQQTTLFTEQKDELPVTSSDIDELVAIGGGLQNTILLMKQLDALGRKYSNLKSLHPDIRLEYDRQRESELAAKNRPATPGPSRPSSGAIRHVGPAVVTATQFPQESSDDPIISQHEFEIVAKTMTPPPVATAQFNPASPTHQTH